MSKITYRNENSGYFQGRAPEEPARMGLRDSGYREEQHYCRGAEREQVPGPQKGYDPEDDFDMYRDDVPHRRNTAPKRTTKKDGFPLWVLAAVFSSVGLFSIFANVISLDMLGYGLFNISPIDSLLGSELVSKVIPSSIPLNISIIAPLFYGGLLALTLHFRENVFDKPVLPIALAIIPAGLMIYLAKKLSGFEFLGIVTYELGFGGYVQIACSAAIIIITLIECGVFAKMTSRSGTKVNYR